MFNNFRKKINSVILDGRIIPDAYMRHQSAPTTVNLGALPHDEHINIRAGCALLDKHTENWQEIHQLNEENAKKAEEIDERVETLKNNSTQFLAQMTDLNSLLVSIPAIVSTLDHCTLLAKELRTNCSRVAEKIYEMQNLIETMDMQSQKLDHQFEMAMYKEKKLVELDQVRKELVDIHSSRVREYENKFKKAQLERQAVFQEAFQSDMECYKTLGTLPKVDLPKPKSELTLEEVVLDNRDTEEFNEFLNN